MSLVVALPRTVPELAVDPGDARDEAVRFDRAQNRAGIGIDLVDLPFAILPDPQRPFGPRQVPSHRRRPAPGSSPGPAGRRDRSSGCDRRRSGTGAGHRRRCRRRRRRRASRRFCRSRDRMPCSASPAANQTWLAVEADAVRRGSTPGNGPYSRTISALRSVLHALDPSRIAIGAGSNKVVANPATGGVSQRRSGRGRASAPGPAAASASSARCTVRWLDPSASASAELDQASPSASSASTAGIGALDRRRQHDDVARSARREREPPAVARMLGERRSSLRKRPISTRSRARWDSSARFAPNARATRHPSRHRQATPRPAHAAARTAPAGARAARPSPATGQRRGTRRRRGPSRPAPPRLPRASAGVATRREQTRGRQRQRATRALDLRASALRSEPGAPHARRAGARRAPARPRPRRSAIPTTTSSCDGLRRRRQSPGCRASRMRRSASSSRPSSRRRRTWS